MNPYALESLPHTQTYHQVAVPRSTAGDAHQVTMLHGAAEDPPAAAADATPAAPQASSPPPSLSPGMQERIAKFNERNSGRRRSPWQVVEDAPLLLQRLWSDLRRGDTQVFGELIRRGVQLQLVVVALYILSPVSFCRGLVLSCLTP